MHDLLPILAALAPALLATALAFYIHVLPFLRRRLAAFMRIPGKVDLLKDLFVNLSLAGPGFGIYLGVKDGSWALVPFGVGWFMVFWWFALILADRRALLRRQEDWEKGTPPGRPTQRHSRVGQGGGGHLE
jgi:hypothetical protein